MNYARAIGLILILLAGSPLAAKADEIIFKNGDKLTGKNATLDGTKITMESAVAGKVTVDLKDIATFSSAEPIDVVLKNGTTIHEKVNTGPDGQITLTPPAGAPMVVALTDVKKLNPPPQVWTGNVVIGGLLARGNTNSQNFNASANFVRRTDIDRITLSGSYVYGRQEFPSGAKSETADDLLGEAKYDYFLNPKLYAFGDIQAEHDVIAGIAVRLAPTAGLGYQWVDDPNFSFNTEGGVGYLYRKYSHDGHTGAAAARAAYHLKVKFNDKVSGFHNFEYFPGLDRISNYFFDTDAGVRANFTEKFFTEFKVEYRYDAKPSPGKGDNDIRFILGVGWAF